ncbi:serpin family protein [Ruminococcus sp. XPD3002]|uniref:serpin family protein n=1 Tax=Ruminococcus sp. XPD3002 TaxID=1452269 RepID=UPI0009131DAF|nr:Serine protease inhibitor [Ruminococcus flavefaciens]
MKKLKQLLKITSLLLCAPLIAGSFSAAAPLSAGRSITANAAENASESHNYRFSDVIITDAVFSNNEDGEPLLDSFTILDRYGYGEQIIKLIPPDLGTPSSTAGEDYEEFTKNAQQLIDEFDRARLIAGKLVKANLSQSRYSGTLVNIDVISNEDVSVDPDAVFSNPQLSSVSKILRITPVGMHYYGDVNDNGGIDIYDLILLRQLITSGDTSDITEDQFRNSDINKSGELDEDDLQQLSEYLLGAAKDFNLPSEIGSIRLDNTVSVEAEQGVEADEKFADSQIKLGIKMLKNLNKSEEKKANMLVSPFSASAALAMTANGADGKTLEEMEKVIGDTMSIDDINNYMAWYISNLPDTESEQLMVADSIWFKDKPSLKIYDSFLETNKKYYNAEIYKTPFDNQTIKDINSWVNTNTKGMIPKLFKENDFEQKTNEDEKVMTLINTVYFNALWEHQYYHPYPATFTTKDGNKKTISALGETSDNYYVLDDALAFKKNYAGRYKFVGILPDEGIDIDDYIESLDPEKLSEQLRTPGDMSGYTVVHTMIPEFDYNYSCSLKETLEQIGMPTAFTYAADFSKINDLSVEGANPLYIADVIQKTNIKLTKKGTEAAAATAVIMAEASAVAPPPKVIDIYLDRPFVYMIVDENDTPIFIGSVTDIGE